VSRRRLARSTPSCFQANATDLAIVDDPVKLEALDRRTALLLG